MMLLFLKCNYHDYGSPLIYSSTVGAHFNLALCHEHGVGLPKDEKEAIKIYRMLAEKYDYNLATKALARLQVA